MKAFCVKMPARRGGCCRYQGNNVDAVDAVEGATNNTSQIYQRSAEVPYSRYLIRIYSNMKTI